MVISPPLRPAPGVLEHHDIYLGEYKIDLVRNAVGNLLVCVERWDDAKTVVAVLDVFVPSDLNPGFVKGG